MEYNCKEADTHKQGILTPIFVIEFQRDVWLGQHKKLYTNGPTLAKIPINTRRALLASIYVMELYKRQWYKKGTLLGGAGEGGSTSFLPPSTSTWRGVLGRNFRRKITKNHEILDTERQE